MVILSNKSRKNSSHCGVCMKVVDCDVTQVLVNKAFPRLRPVCSYKEFFCLDRLYLVYLYFAECYSVDNGCQC